MYRGASMVARAVTSLRCAAYRRNNADFIRVPDVRDPERTEAIMKIFLRAFLTILTAGLATFAGAQTPETTQTPQAGETAPQAASSPHQRQSTTTTANEATNPSKTNPSANSTQHQQEAMRTAQGDDEEDPRMKECVDKVKEKNKGIPDYTARKACREHVKNQGDKQASEG